MRFSSGMDSSPMDMATRVTLTMLRPTKHTRRPNIAAESTTICTRWMLEANIATITRPLACWHMSMNVWPILVSLMV